MDTLLPAILLLYPKNVGQKLDKKCPSTCGAQNAQLAQRTVDVDVDVDVNVDVNVDDDVVVDDDVDAEVALYAKAYRATRRWTFWTKAAF